LIDGSKHIAKAYPIDFKEAAERVCKTKLDDARSVYPRVDSSNLPYLCMDLVYEFTLLVDGFGKLHCRYYTYNLDLFYFYFY